MEGTEMSVPCEQEGPIRSIQREQEKMKDVQQQILTAHSELVRELKDSFKRLESILLSDVEHKKDIGQLRRDVDGIGENARALRTEVAANTLWRAQMQAKYDGKHSELQKYDHKRFEEVANFVQSEKSVRRHIPILISAVALAVTIFGVLADHVHFTNSLAP